VKPGWRSHRSSAFQWRDLLAQAHLSHTGTGRHSNPRAIVRLDLLMASQSLQRRVTGWLAFRGRQSRVSLLVNCPRSRFYGQVSIRIRKHWPTFGSYFRFAGQKRTRGPGYTFDWPDASWHLLRLPRVLRRSSKNLPELHSRGRIHWRRARLDQPFQKQVLLEGDGRRQHEQAPIAL
jgi:hypothetical protein